MKALLNLHKQLKPSGNDQVTHEKAIDDATKFGILWIESLKLPRDKNASAQSTFLQQMQVNKDAFDLLYPDATDKRLAFEKHNARLDQHYPRSVLRQRFGQEDIPDGVSRAFSGITFNAQGSLRFANIDDKVPGWVQTQMLACVVQNYSPEYTADAATAYSKNVSDRVYEAKKHLNMVESLAKLGTREEVLAKHMVEYRALKADLALIVMEPPVLALCVGSEVRVAAQAVIIRDLDQLNIHEKSLHNVLRARPDAPGTIYGTTPSYGG